ncbi:hypothetical protein HDU93_004022, partial [Gonapodya sp. JEL0774]
ISLLLSFLSSLAPTPDFVLINAFWNKVISALQNVQRSSLRSANESDEGLGGTHDHDGSRLEMISLETMELVRRGCTRGDIGRDPG